MGVSTIEPPRGEPATPDPPTSSPDVPVGLPSPLSTFIGREAETAALLALLNTDETRLVTLTGPGGVGKSRLALWLATQAHNHHSARTWFVPLGAITDSAFVLPAIAQVIAPLEPAGHVGSDQLATFFDTDKSLLVLDNFEHLLGAAPLLGALLERCPRLTAMVTSRERLRLSGEREFPLAPLAVPDRTVAATPEVLGAHAATRLFTERAAAVDPEFALTDENAPIVAEICRRLDGLPLAIELAAARCRLLPPPGMLTRLESRLPLLIGGMRDAPARLRTMRDAIGWSYDLLEEDERRLFRTLAVFAGGCSLEAIEAVVAPEAAAPAAKEARSVLDLVGSLVDKSLVQSQAAGFRFTMLETVREFAAERLAASGDEPAVRQRHAEWYLAIAERVEAEAFAGDWELPVAELTIDYDNLRSALSSTTSGSLRQDAVGLRLACALWLFWVYRGQVGEGRRWFELALASSPNAPAALTGKALLGYAGLASFNGDLASAAAVGSDCLKLYQAIDDRAGIARAHNLLGTTALRRGDLAQAISYLELAVAGYEMEPGAQLWLALATAELGVARYQQGERELAARLLDQAAAMRDELGSTWPALFELPTLRQLESGPPASPPVPSERESNAPLTQLSPREREVLRLVADGRSNREIALGLCISPRTASTHVSNILAKLGLTTRAEAIALAFRHGLA